MFCSNCGKEVSKNDKFCTQCGNDLTKNKLNIKDNDKSRNSLIKNSFISKTIKFLRWFLGFILIIPGGVIESNPFSVLLGLTVIPLDYKIISKKIRIAIAIISFLGIGIWAGIQATPNNTTVQNTPKVQNINPETANNIGNKISDDAVSDKKQDSAMLSNDKLPALPKKIDIKTEDTDNKLNSSYDPKILDIIPTEKGKGWDKVLKEYGVDGVKKINALLPQAAELMSKNSSCDKLYYVAYSSRGNPKNIVIFGNCNNGAQVFLSEKEIAAKQVPLTKKEKLKKMELSLMNACDEIVKSRLTHPSTFDKSIFRSRVSTDEYKTTVLVGFTAKNSFNLKLKYNAICIFNDKPELVSFSLEEDK